MPRNDLSFGQDTNNATSFSTGSFQPGKNTLILAFVANISTDAVAPTANGIGLTWELVATETTEIGDSYRISCFRAMAPSPSTGVLKFDFGAHSQDCCAWSIFEFDDVDTSGTNGSGAIVQVHTNAANGNTLTVGLDPFADATRNRAVGGVLLDELLSGLQNVTAGKDFSPVHNIQVDQIGVNATLQTEVHDGAEAQVGWSWSGNHNACGIALELRANAAVLAPDQALALVKRFEPVLYFGEGEKLFPSDAKRYLEHAALWRSQAPFDKKASWGGIGTSFPRQPLISHGNIAALAAEEMPGNVLLDSGINLTSSGTEDRFLELAGWINKGDGAEPDVTANTTNSYSNRAQVASLYDPNSPSHNQTLVDSRFWYHAEVFDTNRLQKLMLPQAQKRLPSGLDLSAVLSTLNNPALVCYYFFFPSREEIVDPGCTNIEAREVASRTGDWECMTLLLERTDSAVDYSAPSWVGLTGRPLAFIPDATGHFVPPPDVFDADKTLTMKANRWKPGGSVQSADLPDAVSTDHAKVFVAQDTHSLYLKAGPVLTSESAYQSTALCGRIDVYTPSVDDNGLQQLEAIIAKLAAMGLLGCVAGAMALAGVGPIAAEFEDAQWGVVLPTPGFDPSPGDIASGLGMTVRPKGLQVDDAGSTLQDWNAEEGTKIGTRQYDILVKRPSQSWWPSDDGTSGFRGRWGPQVDDDAIGRRSGARFPEFWSLFFDAMVKSMATTAVPL